jgi:uncharacterized protein YndB with AHSA1/START domain
MFKKILMALVVLVGVVVVIVSRQPSEFRVTRSLAISAPASAVFAQVNDLHKWKAWSPWAKLDPDATETHEGPAAGKGAIMKWSGNMKVGEGVMAITESRPNDRIVFQLDFVKPMPASNIAEFTFTPQGHQTLVTWSMSGHNNFIGKAMGLVMNCDKMIGGQFEKGLADLNSIVEKRG